MTPDDPPLSEPVTGQPSPEAMSDSAIERMLQAGAGLPGRLSVWAPPSPEEIEALLPDYEVKALIGRGGMGAVYRGVQRSLERAVAIKVLPPEVAERDPQFAARFEQEAKAMARLSHPHIVPVYDFGSVVLPGGQPGSSAHGQSPLLYFVMEFIDGTDLQHIIRNEGHLSPSKAAAIITQVCDALEFAHERGIVHRDIKPSNVMVDQRGLVKVADFGLAKSLEAKDLITTVATLTGSIMGTPAYMAPEQAQGKPVDHRADIYSVGAMFYEMLTGEVPQGVFEPPSQQRIEVDVRLDQVVLKALARDPARRYQRASQVKTDITRVTEPLPKKLPRAWVLAIGTGLLLLASVGGWFFWDKASVELRHEFATEATPRQELDLLATLEPSRDRIVTQHMSGESTGVNAWSKAGGVLSFRSDGDQVGKIAVPVALRATDYEIALGYRCIGAASRFNFDLPLHDGRIFPIALDERGGQIIFPTPYQRFPVAKVPREGRLVTRVHDTRGKGVDHIVIKLDGEEVVNWRGLMSNSQMAADSHPEHRDQPLLMMFCYKSSWDFTEWKLRVYEGAAEQLQPKQASVSTPVGLSPDRTAALLVIERGGRVNLQTKDGTQMSLGNAAALPAGEFSLTSVMMSKQGPPDTPYEFSDEDMLVLSGLKKLNSIQLTNSPITGVGLSVMKTMPSLQTLDINGNQRLKDEDLAQLSGCRSLGTLRFGGVGSFTPAAFEYIAKLTQLSEVSPSGNLVRDEDLKYLLRLPRLRVLRLAGCVLKADALEQLHSLPALEKLTVDLALTDRLVNFAEFPNLRHMECSGLTVDAVKSLATAKHLQQLTLRAPDRLAPAALAQFTLTPLRELKELYLYLSHPLPPGEPFTALPKLERVRIEMHGVSNGFDDAALLGLAKVASLKTLSFGVATPLVTPAGLANFQKLRPQVTVEGPGVPKVSALATPPFPPGQWVRRYTDKSEIDQQWFDWGSTWEDGWIKGRSQNSESIVLSDGKGWSRRNAGARARFRWVKGGNAVLALRRGGSAADFSVRAYQFRLEGGKAWFQRMQGLGRANENDIVPLGDPVELEWTEGQEFAAEAFIIGETLYGRADGRLIVTAKTDGQLVEGGVEIGASRCPMRDLEFINLDGLSEAEAMKSAGLDDAGSPKLSPAPTQTSQRHTAERIISLGGSVGYSDKGRRVSILRSSDIPSGGFEIDYIELPSSRPAEAVIREEDFLLIAQCVQLTQLRLSRLTFTPAMNQALENLKKLRELTLREAVLDGDTLRSIGQLLLLQDLQLDQCPVSGPELAALAALPGLRSLSLTNLPLDRNGLAPLADFRALQSLALHGGAFLDDTCLRTLPTTIKTLERLQFSALNKVTGLGWSHLATMPFVREVEVLSIPDASLHALLAVLPQMPGLETLRLTNYAATDADIPALSGLKRLNSLEVPNAVFSSEGWERLRQALPKCRVAASLAR